MNIRCSGVNRRKRSLAATRGCAYLTSARRFLCTGFPANAQHGTCDGRIVNQRDGAKEQEGENAP